jgi:hypothetical protein
MKSVSAPKILSALFTVSLIRSGLAAHAVICPQAETLPHMALRPASISQIEDLRLIQYPDLTRETFPNPR